jgi:hypothetical protein
MAGLPGSIQSLIPAGPDEQVRRQRDLERRMDEMGPSVARSFAPVIADLTAKQAALDAANVTLTAQQASLTSQLASINALIGSQVYPTTAHVDASTFGLAPGANVEKVRTTISVPSGYTQALVFATATLCAVNSTAVWDDMYLAATINGSSPGNSAQTSVSSGSKGSVTKGISGLLPGLGSTFYVNALASSYTAAWAANANTFVDLDVMVLFLR